VKNTTFKILKSRKGISPILATLLLVVIAVAAIVVTYAWITTYMGTTTQQAGVILYKENVRFVDSTTDATVITVGNQGTADTRLVRVYVGNSASNMTDVSSFVTGLSSGIALNAGSTATINIAWPNDLAASFTAGSTYYFRIVPNPGQFLEFQEKAPQ
jgi:flagellin-like protein